MIGRVYITGYIGSTDEEKGVELQDVVMQVRKLKKSEDEITAIHVHINSPGGSVKTGRLIADYVASLENATTIAEKLCGSIATEIHLAVPVEKRKIVKGTKYFIHNPLLVGISGNADELAEASEFIKKYEKEMLSMYVKATGADKSEIEGLMKAETDLTDEQAKELGFVSEILEDFEMKAAASMFIKDINTKQNKKDMSKKESNIKKVVSDFYSKIKAELGLEDAKAMMVGTDKGELTYESEGELPVVDEVVMMGEEIAESGDYTTADGTIIRVGEGGKVTEVVMPEGGEEDDDVEALKKQIEEMKASHDEQIKELHKAYQEEANKLKEQIGSDYTPKASKKEFGKRGHKAQPSMKEAAAARKKEIEEKKKK